MQAISGPAVTPLIDTDTGLLQVTPPPNYRGLIVFSYQVTDGLVVSEPITATISVGLNTKLRR